MDDDDQSEGRLPWRERQGRGLPNLVKLADRDGHYVTALGGERFQVATMRGRIILKSATYDQAILFLETGEIISEADAGAASRKSRIGWKRERAS